MYALSASFALPSVVACKTQSKVGKSHEMT